MNVSAFSFFSSVSVQVYVVTSSPWNSRSTAVRCSVVRVPHTR
jgi:hypothetical protein